ncbi:hypothetical protein [Brazilian marseillevirus]|uniref:hypothetical protein n=1 Tax=Brazilian marseillevirus TaxID=1813599 RepID=UPI000780B63F|nr:hypothetical protein A3303_gp172 [Brazilian marseillevirus]AMQ10680.1 hypothetical protein [Brazilian marseillevirus]
MDEYLPHIERKQPLLLPIKQDHSHLVSFLEEQGYSVSTYPLGQVKVYFDCKQFRHIAKFEMPEKDYNVQKVVSFILSNPKLTNVSFQKASGNKGDRASVMLISSKLVDWQRYDCNCSCACDKITRDRDVKLRGASWEDTEAYFKYTVQKSHIAIIYK